jgi:flagellar biosynthetic protein FliP
MVRNAIGTPSVPPNQVIIGLSLLLTFFIMAPVYKQMDETAIQPYLERIRSIRRPR